MGQRCRCCAHPDRELLDLALVGGGSNRAVSSHFSVSRASVARHRLKHLPIELLAVKRVQDLNRVEGFAQRIRVLQQEVLQVLMEAKRERALAWQHRVANRKTRLEAAEQLRELIALSEIEPELTALERLAQERAEEEPAPPFTVLRGGKG